MGVRGLVDGGVYPTLAVRALFGVVTAPRQFVSAASRFTITEAHHFDVTALAGMMGVVLRGEFISGRVWKGGAIDTVTETHHIDVARLSGWQ